MFVNSDSCKINGTIKKSVLDLFEELKEVVVEVARANGKLQEKVEMLENTNLSMREEMEKIKKEEVIGSLPAVSYAQVASKNTVNQVTKPKKEHKILVKPKGNQECKDSEEVKRMANEGIRRG